MRDATGAWVRNPLPLLARWQIFDNLRRSLLPIGQLALLAADWSGLPGPRGAWTALALGGPAFPLDLSYNVLVPPAASTFTETARTGVGGNVVFNWLYLDNTLTNNDPYAFVFATPTDNGGINTHSLGVFYFNQRWIIYNEDSTNMLNGQSFNVFVVKRHALALQITLR